MAQNCFYDSIENILKRLDENILKLEGLCKVSSNTQLTNLIKSAETISKLEIYQNLSPDQLPTELTQQTLDISKLESSWGHTSRLGEYIEAMKMNPRPSCIGEYQSGVWSKIEDDLSCTVNDQKLASFYNDNVWKMIRFNRQRVILTSLYSANIMQCLPVDYAYLNLGELFESVIDEYRAESRISKQESLDIKLNTFYANGGVAFSFWVYQNAADMKFDKKTIFEGYVNNQKLFDYSIVKTGPTNISNKFILAGEEVNMPSTSSCAENVFVMLVIQRDCDAYNLKLILRSLGKNMRWSFDKKLTAEQIENVKFNFKDAHVSNMYRDFVYTPGRELSLMVAGTSMMKQQELLANAKTCTDKSIENCFYKTDKGCLECAEPLSQYKGKCVSTCPDGTFRFSKECQECHKTCSKCTSSDNGHCLACNAPYVLDDGKCKDVCPLNKYAVNSECKQCTDFCLECKDTNNCRKCDAGHFLLNGKCVDNCESGYYKMLNPNECRKCDHTCSRCSNLTTCDACIDGYFLKDGRCQFSCGSGFYAERIMNTCFKCMDNCKDCINADTCTKCLEGYSKTDGKCITECPRGTIPIKGACVKCADSNCLSCDPSNISQCNACNERSVLKNGQCVTTCGNFFYENERVCTPCPENCLTCNKDKCFECSDSKVLLEDRECRSNCPDGYVQKGKICIKCTSPLDCKKCNPSNLDICTECYDPFLLQSGRCLSNCDEKFFAKPPKCESCIKNCKKCKDQYTCNKCENGFFLKNNQCVADCGEGFTQVDNICHPCKVAFCDKCSTVDTCTLCLGDRFLYNNKCEDWCPETTYPTPDFQCESCITDCQQCEDSNSCTMCTPLSGKVLQDTICQFECDPGHEPLKGICKKCKNPRCEKCKKDICLSCPPGRLLYQGDCVDKCPDGFYKSTFDNKDVCLPCNKPCNRCLDDKKCIDCLPGFNFVENVCKDNCPDKSIKILDKCVKCTATRCLKCKENLTECLVCENNMFLLDGKCYDKCPNGYFGSNNQCFPCLPGCKECSAIDKCNKCFEDKFLIDNNTCVTKCPEGYATTILGDIKMCKRCTSTCKDCSAENTHQCTKCHSPLMRYKGECRANCPIGFTPVQGQFDIECQACDVQDCSICPTLYSCESCFGDLLLTDGLFCFGSSCEEGYTQDMDRPMCNRCEVKDCKRCPRTNTKLCEECSNGLVLYKDDMCVVSCPPKFYKNDLTMKCESCPQNCISCSNANECNKCESDYFLLNRKCEKECPAGYTHVDDTCVKCHSNNCSSCLKGDPRYCSKCEEPFVLTNAFSLSNKCEPSCPAGEFANADRVCEKCITDCLYCEGSSTCKECNQGKFITDDLRCSDQCPEKTISIDGLCKKCATVDSNCFKCSEADLSRCTMCGNRMILLDNKCLPQCPEGYYEDQNECKKCITGCEKCSNGKTCEQCLPSWVQFENSCHRQCPTSYYEDNGLCVKCIEGCSSCTSTTCDICQKEPKFYKQGGKCVPLCDIGFYPKNSDDCEKCDGFCIQCNGASDCIICEPSFFVFNGRCVQQCPNGHYVNNNICKPCAFGCNNCQSEEICNTCQDPFVLYNGKCVEQCPIGTFMNLEMNMCENCFAKCNRCTSKSSCDKCEESLMVYQTRDNCVEECDDGFTNYNGICTQCLVGGCKSCRNSLNTCDDCLIPFKLYDNECKDTCPIGLYDDNGKCRSCPSQCKSCESGTTCTSCIENFYLENNECKNKCMPGYVAIDAKCDRCTTEFCKACDKDKHTCIACNEDKVLFLKQNPDNTFTTECRENCGDYNYKDGNNICKPCSLNCMECSETQCLNCGNGKVLQDNQCIDRCLDGYVEQNGQCVACNIANCSICDNVTLQNCHVCKPGFALKENTCVTDCGSSFYKFRSEMKDECKPCKDNCKICKNGNSCDICNDNFYLKNNNCVLDCGENYVLKDNQVCQKCADPNCQVCEKNTTTCINCIVPFFMQPDSLCTPRCSERYFSDANDYTCKRCADKFCLECNPQDTCMKCESTMVLLNGKCRDTCPAGYVKVNRNDINICEKCFDNDCSKCVSSKPKQCQECFSLKVFKNDCVETCPDGTYEVDNKYCKECNNPLCKRCFDDDKCEICIDAYFRDTDYTCKDKCQQGYVQVDNKCVKCAQSTCNKCDSRDLSICLDCSPLFENQGRCVMTCPAGTYADGFKCVSCDSTCATCLNGSTCLACKNGLVLQGDRCLRNCYPGYIYDQDSNMCKQCSDPAKCEVCNPTNPDICQKCQLGFLLDGSICVDKCSANKWQDRDICKECTQGCSNCSSLTECRQCNDPFVLMNKKCVDACPSNFVNILGKCKQCENQKCRECELANLKQCKTCFDGFWLYKQECVNACPTGTYFDDNSCVDCDSKCDTCASSNTCLKCKAGFKLDRNGNCSNQCPEYTVERNGVCLACGDAKCNLCSTSDLNECFDCKNSFLLGRLCQTTCPEGYRSDIGSRKCIQCPANCKKCDETGCLECMKDFYFFENTSSCITCKEPYTIVQPSHCTSCKIKGCIQCLPGKPDTCNTCQFDRIKFKNKCITTCPDGFYKSSNECKACSTDCLKCENENTCTVCQEGFLNYNGTCLEECPMGWIPTDNNTCVKCNQDDCEVCNPANLEICMKCKDGLVKYKDRCERACPNGTYKKDDICINCNSNCEICEDAKTCVKCLFELRKLGNDCVTRCPEGYVDDGTTCQQCSDMNCLTCNPLNICQKCNSKTFLDKTKDACFSNCPEGTYANLMTRECKSCSPGCQTCDAEKCIKCKDNIYIQNGMCKNPCNQGFTNVNSVCKSCQDNTCNVCAPEDPTSCTDCRPNFVYNNQCVQKCPQGTFPAEGNKCIECDLSCLECTSKGNCTKCKNEFIVEKGICINSCPDGKVLFNGQCVQCADSKCKKCLTETTKCVECNAPYVLNGDTCNDVCTDGFYTFGAKCIQCPDNCTKCSGTKSCTACQQGYFLSKGECRRECPEGEFPDCKTNACLQCNPACANCFDSTPESCIKCAAGYFKENKLCVASKNCKPGFYADKKTGNCAACKIAMCDDCPDGKLCKTCLRGFQLAKNGALCIQSTTSQNVFVSSQLFSSYVKRTESSRLTYTFNQQLKGIAVSSSIVTFSFWIRKLKSSGSSNIFTVSTANSAISLSMNTRLVDNKQICEITYITSNGVATPLSTVECSYDNMKEWAYFLISYSKKRDNTGQLRVIVSINGKLEEFLVNIPTDISYLIQKETTLQFYQSTESQDSFEMTNFNILDYYPDDDEIFMSAEAIPDSCDYMCSDCRGSVCHKCSNGAVSSDNTCPASYIPIKTMNTDINTDTQIMLREKVTKRNFSSKKFAVTFWFYLTNITNDEDFNLIGLYYDNSKGTTDLNNVVLNISVSKRLIVLNSKYLFNHELLTNNKWYMISVHIKDSWSAIHLRDMSGKFKFYQENIFTTGLPIIYDDLTFILGNSYGITRKTHIKGSIFDFRFYINNYPTDSELDAFTASVKCPENCNTCSQDFSCEACNEGFKLGSDNKCVDVQLETSTLLLEKMSLWNKDTLDLTIPVSVKKTKFSISLWIRKKRQSPLVTPSEHSLVSIISLQDATKRQTLIKQYLKENYISEFSIQWLEATTENRFNHDFSNEIHEYMHIVMNFDMTTNTLEYNIKDRETVLSKTGSFNIDFNTIVIGDANGSQMNLEIAWVNYYPQILNSNNINKLRATPPKDCDASCVSCDYKTGICKTCIQKNDKSFNVEKCPTLFKGFSSVTFFEKKSYSDPINIDAYSVELNRDFKVDVNSLGYGVIGWFRVLDFSALLAKNGRYAITAITNINKGPIDYPGANLLAIEIRVAGGKAQFVWVINELNQLKTFPFDPQPNLEGQSWILIHGGINVKDKVLSYKYRTNDYTSAVITNQLSIYPQKLCETASLRMFGFGRTLNDEYVQGNGQFHEFYLVPNSAYSDKIFDYFANKKPLNDLECSTACTKCFSVEGKSLCVECQAGYSINNYICLPPVTIGYQLLSDKWVDLNKGATFTINKFNFNNLRTWAIGFYMRRNYLRSTDAKQLFMELGNMRIYTVIVLNTYNLSFEFDGVQGAFNVGPIDKDISADYKWHAITVSFSNEQSKVLVNIKDLDKSVITSLELPVSVKAVHDNKLTVNNANYEFEIYNLHVADRYVDFPIIEKPSFKDCDVDCDACNNGICLSCGYGYNKDGSCRANTLTLNTRLINNKNYQTENVLKLVDYFGKARLLRSNKFTLIFSFEFNINADSFRVLRLINANEDIEPANQVSNFFTLTYIKSLRKFVIKISNRQLSGSNKIIEQEIIYPLPTTTNLHYVSIGYDGYGRKLTLNIANSKTNTVSKEIVLEGYSEYITNYTNIYLANYFSKATTDEFIKYRDWKLFYTQGLTNTNILINLINSYLKDFQAACTVSSRNSCITCSTKAKNGVCTPTDDVFVHFRNDVKQYNYDYSRKAEKFTAMGSDKFSLSFWWRRISFSNYSYGIIKLNYVNASKKDIPLLDIFYENNSLIVTGRVGTVNKVVLPDLYGDKDQLDWIHITVAYDIAKNNIYLYVINENGKTNTKENPLNATKNGTGIVATSGVQNYYYIIAYDNTDDTSVLCNFELSAVAFTPSVAFTSRDAELYRIRKPRECTDACNTDCFEEMCPPNKRITNEFNLNNLYVLTDKKQTDDIATINSLFQYRPLKQLTTTEADTAYYSNFIISYELNISNYFTSRYTANKNILMSLSNNNSKDIIEEKTMGDLIDPSQYKYGVVSLIHEDGNLIIYTSTNKTTDKPYFTKISLTKGLKSYNNLYMSMFVDYRAKFSRLYIYLDDLAYTFDIDAENPTQFITLGTIVYNHPATTNFKLNVFNPRFDIDFERNYYTRPIFTETNSATQSCQNIENNCNKCLTVRNIDSKACLKCDSGFTLLDTSSCFASSNKK
jgi:hypothetical protein